MQNLDLLIYIRLTFKCEYSARVKDVDKKEKGFHTEFEPSRVNPKREFFNINPEQAIAVLSLMAIEDVTPSVQEKAKTIDIEATASAEKFKKKRRPTINYFEMGLKEGDILKFGRNEEFCTVLNGRQVSYKGEPWFLSNLTNKLLDRTGAMDGSPYWYFKGKNLKDIYNETYTLD